MTKSGRTSFVQSNSCLESKSRSNSNAFKGDRFIPFRGTQDNFFEEFIMNNDLYKDQKKKKSENGDDVQMSVTTDN